MRIFFVFILFFVGLSFVLQTEKSIRRIIKISDIKVEKIHIHNRWRGDRRDQILTTSIEEIGLLHNIFVRPIKKSKKKYILVHGARRLEASKIAGVKQIPCIVLYNLTGKRAIVMAVIMCFSENLGRKNYSSFQTMIQVKALIQLLIDEQGIGKNELEIKRIRRQVIKKVANLAFGGEPSTVYKILQTNDLPVQLQVLIKDPSERTELEKKIIEKHKLQPEFKLDFKTCAVIEKINQNLGACPQREKIQKIFDIIRTFRLDKKKYNDRYELLSKFRDNLKKKSFEIVMQEVMREEALDVNIHFTIKDVEYIHWHRLACEQKQLTSAQIAKDVYCKWLYRKILRNSS